VRLQSYLAGRWQDGSGPGTALKDPVTGEEVARASGDGLDLGEALSYARTTGGPTLRAMSFAQRAQLLNDIAAALTENKERYGEIALKSYGSTPSDAILDVDGGIGTIKYFARLGAKLGDARYLVEAGTEQLGKDEAFRGMHIWTPVHGVAIHINAFNFPSWGLWEKAAVSLLAGVPFLAKPATATAWLAYEMVKDVVAKNVVPAGAMSLLCGGGRELMDLLQPGDAVAFTGSADTAATLRSNPNVMRSNIRFSVEADSLNLCCLGPDATADSPVFGAMVREVVRELTIKAGQKCTAIRRVLVPAERLQAVVDAVGAELAKVRIGDPRDPEVRMGPLVNKAQQAAAWDGLAKLGAETRVAYGGQRDWAPPGIDPAKGCFVQPTLLVCDNPDQAKAVHEVEVFGPVATVMPYRSAEDAVRLAIKGGGSLTSSVFTADPAFATGFATAIGVAHGRVLVVTPEVAKSHSGHGVVLPHLVHGGPGRAGGGEELGGLRGLRLYLQRTAVQGHQEFLAALAAQGAVAAL
jgi:3,4-dehydroadipyl-CoA semialdehyde dehydrogenase